MRKFVSLLILTAVIFSFGCTTDNSGSSPNVTIDDEISISPDLSVDNEQISPPFVEDNDEISDSNDPTDTITPTPTLYAKYLVSKTDNLRIRSRASSSSSVLGYLDKNDALSILGESGSYYKTVYKENTAYVHKSYCKIMEIEQSGEKEEKAIELGCTLLGYPYVWGSQRYHWGNGKLNTNFIQGEFDCSALVQYVYFKSNGVNLDLTTRTQVNQGTFVNKSELKRGDLMFFTNASRKSLTGNERVGHVGIYLGNNYILHTASDHAVIEPISDTRWSYYITSRRVV